ncbi:MAG: AtpZ/AtpI family protein [Candidatus Omnitrophica bacterium]|nr:AtpZ/AtpI family protein [Candidatus Omnitrophota bacterium]
MTSDPDPYDWFKRVGTLVSIPLVLGVSPVVGAALGYGLDRLLKTQPIFTLIGLALGFAAGVRETRSLIRKASSEEDRK